MGQKLIAFLNLPGIVFHELGHQVFCYLMGIKVHRVKYFSFGDPAGFVEHDSADNFLQAFFISVGPLITGTAIGLYIYKLSFAQALHYRILLVWLGFIIIKNSFPSSGDAGSLLKEVNLLVKRNILAILGYPLALIVWAITLMERIHLNISYAILLYLIFFL